MKIATSFKVYRDLTIFERSMLKKRLNQLKIQLYMLSKNSPNFPEGPMGSFSGLK